jgi:hypothetical protein
MYVFQVEDGSESYEEVSQPKSSSNKVKMGSHSFTDGLFYSCCNFQLYAGQSKKHKKIEENSCQLTFP